VTTSSAVPLIVSEPARRRLGIFTTADLATAGVTEPEVRSAIRSGRWVRLRTGVFVRADDLAEVERTGRRPGLDALVVTTGLARPSAALSGSTAAWVWGLPRPRGAAQVVRLTDPDRWRRGRGWVMTRAALLRRLATRGELRRVLDRQVTVPGVPKDVRALELADGRAESWLETCGRLTFAALGLPPFVPQVELWVQGRLLKVADGWYADAALAVEFDGRVKYRSPRFGRTPEQELWEEKRREDLLCSFGVRFVRGTTEDVGPGRAELDRLVRRHLATPGPAIRQFREVPRAEGRRRGDDPGDDGWLSRTDDGVGRAA
jgi:hypothetical protein